MPVDKLVSVTGEALRILAACDEGLDRWRRRHSDGWAGLLQGALAADELTELGLRLYRRSLARSAQHIFAWERQWWEEQLPPPPATLLLGGAGDGREALHLIQQGYRVVAFEPESEAAGRYRRRTGSAAIAATYEQVSATVLDGSVNAAAALADQRYDGALMGWGSLSHVLLAHERERAVRALGLLAPMGPVLASFFSRRGPATERSTAWRAGNALGRSMGTLRGITSVESDLQFGLRFGFAAALQIPDDVDALAKAAGRRAVWSLQPGMSYAHVTFVRGAGHE